MNGEVSNLPLRLIAGLGNPGKQYEATRHNIGFMAVDRLAAKWGAAFSKHGKWDAMTARAGDIYLLKPLSFMNLSGEAINACRLFYKLAPEQVLVVYDDVALPLGKLRMRPGGSAGGHNGMKSIIQHLGTDRFPRLRLGIGAADGKALIGHVLGRFAPEEREAVDKSLDRAVEAVILATLRGLPAAMQSFNTEESPPGAPRKSRPAKASPPAGNSLTDNDKPKPSDEAKV